MARLAFLVPERPPVVLASDRVMLGRDPTSDIVLEGIGVSRRHASITVTPIGFVLEDQKSRNGTFVNGQAITGPLVLSEGDRIVIDTNEMRVEDIPSDLTMVIRPSDLKLELETVYARRVPDAPAAGDRMPAAAVPAGVPEDVGTTILPGAPVDSGPPVVAAAAPAPVPDDTGTSTSPLAMEEVAEGDLPPADYTMMAAAHGLSQGTVYGSVATGLRRPRFLVFRDDAPFTEYLMQGKEAVVGRGGEAAVNLPDDCVSRQHARFRRGGKGILVEDLDAVNHVYVNGVRQRQAWLKPEDVVTICNYKLVYLEPGAVVEQAHLKRLLRRGRAVPPKVRLLRRIIVAMLAVLVLGIASASLVGKRGGPPNAAPNPVATVDVAKVRAEVSEAVATRDWTRARDLIAAHAAVFPSDAEPAVTIRREILGREKFVIVESVVRAGRWDTVAEAFAAVPADGLYVPLALDVIRKGGPAAVAKILDRAQRAAAKGLADEAIHGFELVLNLDPGNRAAGEGLAQLRPAPAPSAAPTDTATPGAPPSTASAAPPASPIPPPQPVVKASAPVRSRPVTTKPPPVAARAPREKEKPSAPPAPAARPESRSPAPVAASAPREKEKPSAPPPAPPPQRAPAYPPPEPERPKPVSVAEAQDLFYEGLAQLPSGCDHALPYFRKVVAATPADSALHQKALKQIADCQP